MNKDFFTALVLHKNLAFNFRAWGPNKYHGPYGCQSCDSLNIERYEKALPFTSLIYYAAEIGHVPVLKLFDEYEASQKLSMYCTHESLHEPLLRASPL